MNIDKLDKHIHLTDLPNGAIDVTIFGQSAFTITKSLLPSFVGDTNPQGSSFYWSLNPLFAKLSYGANTMVDLPYCMKNHMTAEEAIADGIDTINKLGAFKSNVDLPEDSYTAKFNQEQIQKALFDAQAELRSIAMYGRGLFESAMYIKNFNAKRVTPKHTVEELMEKFNQGTPLTEAEKISVMEHNAISKACITDEGLSILSEMKFEQTVDDVSKEVSSKSDVVETKIEIDTRTTFEKFKSRLNEERENKRKIITHSLGDKESHVYRLPDTNEYKVEFAQNGKRNPEADYYTDDKEDAHGTAKLWLNQKNEADERNRSEFTANTQLADKKEEPKKKVRIIGPSGGTVSKHDDTAQAKAHFTNKGYSSSKGYSIQEELDDGTFVTSAIMESIRESDDAYEKWVADVKAKHTGKDLKFKGRVENGVHTTSAEETGKDRSYGVWDHEKDQGHIFESSIKSIGSEYQIDERELTSSEKEKQEAIIDVLKKRPGFKTKYGKDAIYAVATTLAKTAGG